MQMSKIIDRNYREDHRSNKTIDYNINQDKINQNPENLRQKQFR